MQRMIQLDFQSRTKNSTPSVVRTPTRYDSATLQKQGLLATYTTQNVWPLAEALSSVRRQYQKGTNPERTHQWLLPSFIVLQKRYNEGSNEDLKKASDIW